MFNRKTKTTSLLLLVTIVWCFLLFLTPIAHADDLKNQPGAEPTGKGNFGWMCKSQGICKNGDAGRFYPHLEYGYQCVWYAWNRLAMIHGSNGWAWKIGDGGEIWHNMANDAAWQVSTTPKVGWGASARASENSKFAYTTHVAVVEKVNADQSIVISEGNGDGSAGWNSYDTRTLSKADWTGVHFFNNKSWKAVAGADSGDAGKAAQPSSKSSASSNKETIPDEDNLVGMNKPKPLQNDGVPDAASKSQLSKEDRETLAELQDTSNMEHKMTIADALGISVDVIGFAILIYGTLILWCAFIFDKSNTIFEFSALSFVSFGHYRLRPVDFDDQPKPSKHSKTRYLTAASLASVTLIAVVISGLLLSGKLLDWITDLWLFIHSQS